MSHSKEIQSVPPKVELLDDPQEVEAFNTGAVAVGIVILAIAAYIPAFLDERFYARLDRAVIVILLGVLYGFLATRGMARFERYGTRQAFFLYFGLVIGLIFVIFLLSRDFNNNFWLLMLPISAQGIALTWVGALGVSVVQMIGFWLIYGIGRPFSDMAFGLLSIATAMLFSVMFTTIAVRESDSRVKIEQLAKKLRSANQRLAAYATQAEELAITQERNRLAREIHDNLGHYLTVVNVQIEAAKTVMAQDPEKAREMLDKAQRLTQEGLGSVRHSVSALRESPVGERPLSEAVAALAEETRATGIVVETAVHGERRRLHPKTELTLYRAVQEGLTNVRKYARASRVDVTLDYTNAAAVSLTISDNGVGAAELDSGFGLLGLRERVQLLDGTMAVETAVGDGFTLHITLPTAEE